MKMVINFSTFVKLLFLCVLCGVVVAREDPADALRTDGIDDYAAPLAPTIAGAVEGTVEFWFSSPSWGGSEAVWCAGAGHPGTNFDMARFGSHFSAGSEAISFGIFSGVWRWSNSGQVLVDNTWYHFAGTWGAEGVKIYINGELMRTNTFTGQMSAYAVDLIGAGTWGDYTSGDIDELRIWNLARDSLQIRETMLSILEPHYYESADSGLVAYFRMDELEDLGIGADGADDLRDLSVNANHADTYGEPELVESGAFVITSIEDSQLSDFPATFRLEQNYPNPFNPSTVIRYSLDSPSNVRLTIYDSSARRVKQLAYGNWQMAGSHVMAWDGKDYAGMPVASGMYFYELKTSTGHMALRKMVLLR